MLDSDQKLIRKQLQEEQRRRKERRVLNQEECTHTQPATPEHLLALFPDKIAADLARSGIAALHGQYTLDGDLCVCCNLCNKLRTYSPINLLDIREPGSGDDFDEIVRRVLTACPDWFGKQLPFDTGE